MNPSHISTMASSKLAPACQEELDIAMEVLVHSGHPEAKGTW